MKKGQIKVAKEVLAPLIGAAILIPNILPIRKSRLLESSSNKLKGRFLRIQAGNFAKWSSRLSIIKVYFGSSLLMNIPYIIDKKFQRLDYSQDRLPKGEYEQCVFENCIFSNGDLSNVTFRECEFVDCDLSNAKLKNTGFSEIVFKGCKLLGCRFDECNSFLFSFKFEHCTLNLSSFYELKLKNMVFKHCKLLEADFTRADLGGSLFDDCDLQRAIFENTNLEKVNFITSINYSLDPENNNIKKAKFSKEGVLGLLSKYHIILE